MTSTNRSGRNQMQIVQELRANGIESPKMIARFTGFSPKSVGNCKYWLGQAGGDVSLARRLSSEATAKSIAKRKHRDARSVCPQCSGTAFKEAA